eukprot:scaffold1019_cov255-Pinguiococcus_pyrenoidosus.AAC.16
MSRLSIPPEGAIFRKMRRKAVAASGDSSPSMISSFFLVEDLAPQSDAIASTTYIRSLGFGCVW